jgi:hypothetical protein
MKEKEENMFELNIKLLDSPQSKSNSNENIYLHYKGKRRVRFLDLQNSTGESSDDVNKFNDKSMADESENPSFRSRMGLSNDLQDLIAISKK